MAGLRELSALATSVHEPSSVKANDLATHPADKSRPGHAKRRRLQHFRAPCADNLESLHATWEVSPVLHHPSWSTLSHAVVARDVNCKFAFIVHCLAMTPSSVP